MKIRNLSKNKALASNAALCTDILPKAIGLMFSKKSDKTLIFKFEEEKIISLHMLFVFYAIDVLFLDKNKIVVDKKEKFMPFTFYSSKKKARYAIELPSGTAKKTKTEIGDKIEF